MSLIKSVSDYCKVGLKVSYFALENFDTLKIEKINMVSIINTSLIASRNSFSKLNLPLSYRNLIELEIKEDFTMGYVNEIGFRAGTCTPFLFYDIDYEIQTPLMVNTYHLMDYALLKNTSLLDKKETLLKTIDKIKKVKDNLTHHPKLAEDISITRYGTAVFIADALRSALTNVTYLVMLVGTAPPIAVHLPPAGNSLTTVSML